MPPKKGNKGDKGQKKKDVKKVVADKTFGMKNVCVEPVSVEQDEEC